ADHLRNIIGLKPQILTCRCGPLLAPSGLPLGPAHFHGGLKSSSKTLLKPEIVRPDPTLLMFARHRAALTQIKTLLFHGVTLLFVTQLSDS
ncbi:MAG: hypothetical protein OEQ18_17225, partial [Gammaproteobacteria bacterium]|nr:hypothetical protein [Gammaproteobacteria bacterium]